ncbi:MAG: acyltransferase family protein [Methylococcaceae bacterium]|jgi:peptidoglycan/LPS O-acetylase OafA/YrhL
MKNRLCFIDTLRGFSVLYIVGFWHLMNYTDAFPNYANFITMRITVSVLALFVFLSGYLMSNTKLDLEIKIIKVFYIKRFLRIYPLYVFSLFLFFLLHLSNKITLIKAGLLISMFYGPPPPTLWFITMIIVFYLLTPLLISAKNTSKLLFRGIVLMLLMMLLSYISPKSDPRLLIYFPAFISGIYMAKSDHLSKGFITKILVLLFGSVVLSVQVNEAPEVSYASIPLAIFSPLAIFYIFSSIKLPINSLVKHISYAGYVMYLIHRPIYELMLLVYYRFLTMYSFNMETLKVGYLIFICLPVIVVISYFVQKSYDKLILNL